MLTFVPLAYGDKRPVVTRYDLDPYGRPRVLSRGEILFHVLAWATIAGVSLGFLVAILLSLAGVKP
jgi:hypothetical protein